MASVELEGQVRSGSLAGQPVKLQTNESKELLTAQGLPEGTEMTRLGLRWNVQTATLFAPLTAIPTTTAALELYNNMDTWSMVIDDLFAAQVLATAVAATFAIYACVSTKKAAPTNTALSIFSANGKASITSTAAGDIVTAINTTVVANGWRPYGPAIPWSILAATPGYSFSVPVNGKLIVPPKASLCLHIMGSLATASSWQVGASWVTALVENR